MNETTDLALEGGLTSSNLTRPTDLGRIGRMLTAPMSRWRRATSYRGRSKARNVSLGLAILIVWCLIGLTWVGSAWTYRSRFRRR